MINKTKASILSLAAALAALGTVVAPDTADAALITPPDSRASNTPLQSGGANLFYSVGDDLMAFTVTQAADGTLVAQHHSHSSHSSHSSHASHASSRY